MLVLFGKYSIAHRKVVFRNDYCRVCNVARVAFLHRTFDILHLFFVPVLPLGFWKRWHCGVCGNNPHVNQQTRKSLKWSGTVILILGSVSMWAVSATDIPEDPAILWIMRIGLPVAAVFALRATLRSPPDVQLKDLLRTVRPATDTRCPVCNSTLEVTAPHWRCSRCGIERRSLRAA